MPFVFVYFGKGINVFVGKAKFLFEQGDAVAALVVLVFLNKVCGKGAIDFFHGSAAAFVKVHIGNGGFVETAFLSGFRRRDLFQFVTQSYDFHGQIAARLFVPFGKLAFAHGFLRFFNGALRTVKQFGGKFCRIAAVGCLHIHPAGKKLHGVGFLFVKLCLKVFALIIVFVFG